MKMFALTIPLLLAASPVAAQQQQALGAGGQINNSTLPNTGLICIQEMVATFCNLPVGPEQRGLWRAPRFLDRAPGLERAPAPDRAPGPELVPHQVVV